MQWNKNHKSLSKGDTVLQQQTEHADISRKGGTLSKPPEYFALVCFTLEGMVKL